MSNLGIGGIAVGRPIWRSTRARSVPLVKHGEIADEIFQHLPRVLVRQRPGGTLLENSPCILHQFVRKSPAMTRGAVDRGVRTFAVTLVAGHWITRVATAGTIWFLAFTELIPSLLRVRKDWSAQADRKCGDPPMGYRDAPVWKTGKRQSPMSIGSRTPPISG